MKRLAYIAVILLALCAVGKGQISPGALHRLIGNPSSSSGPAGIPGLNYWWVASDLGSNTNLVTNWVDRISGSAWVNNGTKQPTNSNSGVYFRNQNQLTNNSPASFGTNSTHFLIVRRDSDSPYQFLIMSNWNGTANSMAWSPSRWSYYTNGYECVTGPLDSPSVWRDVTFTSSLAGTLLYTNGYSSGCSNAIAMYGSWGLMGGYTATYYIGWVREFLIYNRTLTAAEVANLHTYATNTYGYTP